MKQFRARQRAYLEKLQDPRWQKKRLSVFESAGWRCEWCSTGKVNLQVHHGYYMPLAEPWDYPDEALYCLCNGCHERAEVMKREAHRRFGLIHPKHHAHILSLLLQLRDALKEQEPGKGSEVLLERVR